MSKDFMKIVLDRDGFKPGEKVTGHVILECRKPLKANFLKASIIGKAKCSWTESKSKPTISIHGVGRKFTIEWYKEQQIQIDSQSDLWVHKEGNDGFIAAGQNSFPFSFELPPDCLHTYKGSHGKVKYQMKCQLDSIGSWKYCKVVKQVFQVIPHYDLNELEIEGEATYQQYQNTGMFFKNGIVKYKYTVPKHGFIEGESIPISFEIDNQSSKTVYIATAYLMKISKFSAAGHKTFVPRKVVESQTKCVISPGTKDSVSVELKVPKVEPSFDSDLIEVYYRLYVGVRSLSTFKGNVWDWIQITIGTVPMEMNTE